MLDLQMILSHWNLEKKRGLVRVTIVMEGRVKHDQDILLTLHMGEYSSKKLIFFLPILNLVSTINV